MKTPTKAIVLAFLLGAVSPAFAQDVTQDVNAPQDLLARSLTAIRGSDWENSARLAHAALETNGLSSPDTLAAATALCIALTNAGRYREAAATCDQSIELAPDRWSGYLNRANLRLMSGDKIGAAHDYRTAKSLNPAEHTGNRSQDMIANGYSGLYVAVAPAPRTTQTAIDAVQ